jgi:3-methyladenine DNA glycosylase AlkD
LNYNSITQDIHSLANPKRAKHSQRFFKTGKGEYAEGDKFLGLTVPQQRKIASKFKDLTLNELEKLIKIEYHEHRFTALVILVNKFKKSESEVERTLLTDFYLNHTKYINNWDLVDTSAKILGEYFYNKDRKVLLKLAKSTNLWEQRIAIVSTAYFIDRNEFTDTLKIAETLLDHKHDLIHKAVGWMLREVGKKNLDVELEFLNLYYKQMPRTMLRYSIEKFPGHLRKYYLKK